MQYELYVERLFLCPRYTDLHLRREARDRNGMELGFLLHSDLERIHVDPREQHHYV